MGVIDDPSKRTIRQRICVVIAAIVVLGLSSCIGGVFSLLTRDVYVPVLVPVGMGVSVGAVVGFFAYLLDRVSFTSVILAALLGWCGAVTVFHLVEYEFVFKRAVQQELELDTATSDLSGQDVQQMADSALLRGVGTPGFWGFLKLRARSGIRVRLSGRIWTGYGPGLAVWAFDILLGGFLVIRIVRGVRKRRVLEATD